MSEIDELTVSQLRHELAVARNEIKMLKISDCSNPYGCRRQASFDEWHAAITAERDQLRAELADALQVCGGNLKAGLEMKAERDRLLQATSPIHAHVDALRAERDQLRAYADKLARGLPEGMLPKDIELLREGNAQLATEVERLCAALQEAIEAVEAWGAYASEYFQQKHDLAGTLARLRAALGRDLKA